MYALIQVGSNLCLPNAMLFVVMHSPDTASKDWRIRCCAPSPKTLSERAFSLDEAWQPFEQRVFTLHTIHDHPRTSATNDLVLNYDIQATDQIIK